MQNIKKNKKKRNKKSPNKSFVVKRALVEAKINNFQNSISNKLKD